MFSQKAAIRTAQYSHLHSQLRCARSSCPLECQPQDYNFNCNVHSESLVEFDGVDFSYGTTPILSNINIGIPQGKIIAIMGGSGSGKTTLLRLIGGQLRPNKGEVRFDGGAIGSMSHAQLYASRRRMGMLFQFGALFTDLSVFENVAFPYREHLRLPEPMIRDLVLMKLHAVGLRGAHRLMPAELSGGMARRVALARAIALDPSLMIYDEPFTGLDPISVVVIAKLIQRLNAALGATSIIVTHDLEASFKIADYVYLISQGEIVAQGTPADLYESEEPYVRQFVQGQGDGPVSFHYPAGRYDEDLGMGAG
jgi:phospholipid/cholesterol/gamma-HCH transport system ATP-binding protein